MDKECSITLSSSLGWTTIYYKDTLLFNIYYFVVQQYAGRRFKLTYLGI